MNAKAALIKSLLAGDTVSIMSGFKNLGITNVPREISRCVEQPFGVIVSRMKREGKSRYGVPCNWFEYRLNPLIGENSEGIQKMAKYLAEHDNSSTPQKGATIEHIRKEKKQLPLNITITPLFN